MVQSRGIFTSRHRFIELHLNQWFYSKSSIFGKDLTTLYLEPFILRVCHFNALHVVRIDFRHGDRIYIYCKLESVWGQPPKLRDLLVYY